MCDKALREGYYQNWGYVQPHLTQAPYSGNTFALGPDLPHKGLRARAFVNWREHVP